MPVQAGIAGAFAILAGCQLAGEVIRQALHVTLPGPLIGMLLLTVALLIGGLGHAPAVAEAPPLVRSANGLVNNMGLFFVPAGVGVIAELGVLRQQWVAILVALLVSTVAGLAVTGLVMQHVSRRVESRRPRPAGQVLP